MGKYLNAVSKDYEVSFSTLKKSLNASYFSDNYINSEVINKKQDSSANASFINYSIKETKNTNLLKEKLLTNMLMIPCRIFFIFFEIIDVSSNLMTFDNLSLNLTLFKGINYTIKLQTFSTFPFKVQVIPICNLKLLHFFLDSYNSLEELLSSHNRVRMNIQCINKKLLTGSIDLSEFTSPLVNQKSYKILLLGKSNSNLSCLLKVV